MPLAAELWPIAIARAYEMYGDFENPFAKYFPSMPNPVVGTEVRIDLLRFQRQMARYTSRNGGPNLRAAPYLDQVRYEAPTMKEAIELPPEWRDVRQPGTISEAGFDYFWSRTIRQINLDMERRKGWFQGQFLTAGMLLSSAGVSPAVTTTGNALNGDIYVDYALGPANQPKKIAISSLFPSTHIANTVAASWATSTTDIRKDLDTARLLCRTDSGRDPRLVLCNPLTLSYITRNAVLVNAINWNNLMINYSAITDDVQLFGYTFRPVPDMFPVADDMATSAGTLPRSPTMQYYIPTNTVILMCESNEDAGRMQFDCSPSDWRAGVEARGLFPWVDIMPTHPHHQIPGIEYTGGPCIMNPWAMYVWATVASTT